MELDGQKFRLLQTYARTAAPRRQAVSPSGLELFLPRTSTPKPVTTAYVDDKAAADPYEIFRHILEIPPKKAAVRGMDKVPYDFISGHLVKSSKNEKLDYSSISLDTTGVPKKVTLKSRYDSFKKTMRNFFERNYKNYVRNKCDDGDCPVTCECQRMKSFLNKTVVIDDETDVDN